MEFSLQRSAEEDAGMNGSDLHITTNSPPQIRVHGHLVPLEDLPQMTPAETKQLAYSVLTDPEAPLRRKPGTRFFLRLERTGALPRQPVQPARRHGGGFPRDSVRDQILRPAQPAAGGAANLCDKPRGLILVTGPPDRQVHHAGRDARQDQQRAARAHAHDRRSDRIRHMNKNCLVNQRELHADTNSFTDALRAALREDPTWC
jgi:twitching motility protein PilT